MWILNNFSTPGLEYLSTKATITCITCSTCIHDWLSSDFRWEMCPDLISEKRSGDGVCTPFASPSRCTPCRTGGNILPRSWFRGGGLRTGGRKSEEGANEETTQSRSPFHKWHRSQNSVPFCFDWFWCFDLGRISCMWWSCCASMVWGVLKHNTHCSVAVLYTILKVSPNTDPPWHQQRGSCSYIPKHTYIVGGHFAHEKHFERMKKIRLG